MKFENIAKKCTSILVVTVTVLTMICWSTNQQRFTLDKSKQLEKNEILFNSEDGYVTIRVPLQYRLAEENVSVDILNGIQDIIPTENSTDETTLETTQVTVSEITQEMIPEMTEETVSGAENDFSDIQTQGSDIDIEELKKQALIADTVLPIENLYQDTDVDSFFDDAIFVGDSLTVGLSNYYKSQKGKVFSPTTQFLAQIGCSAKMCLSYQALTTYAKYMPSYNGKLCKVEDGVAESGAKKVFIDYGLNDLVGVTPDEHFQNMILLINNILEKNPDARIYVIGTTYVVEGAEKGSLTNANIHEANEKMKTYCQEVGWGYINIADYLADNNGTLQSIYSSDQYVHQNSRAYEIWVKVLRNYAKQQLEF